MRLSELVYWGGEIVARYVLGLGDPPLSVTHPTIEYMFKPDQDAMRFGNRFKTNSYGMRSEKLSESKNDDELRILVFGDSVINGGNLTDQSELATEIVKSDLSENQKISIANVSAGSWGPGNWLAYAKEYGFFDANIVFLTISSHDYADNPSFKPLNKNTHPTVKPNSALFEAVERYLPNYLPKISIGNESESEKDKMPPQDSVQTGLNDLKEFLMLALKNADHVVVIQHLTRTELEAKQPQEGYYEVQKICESLSIPCISLEPKFRAAVELGVSPFRDDIHVNTEGQKLIAEVILDIVNQPEFGTKEMSR